MEPTHKVDIAIPERREAEPRWPALLAILITGALYGALPEELSFGRRWLLLVIIVCLSVPTMIAHHTGRRATNTVLGYAIESIMTVFLMWSVVMLVISLPSRTVTPESLLRSAAALWICNVVLFSLWYWRLDAGGPYARHNRVRHEEGAFLFPPMTNDGKRAAGGHWSPRFIDYLFLSFNTSTALSPTDTAIISRWAKILVMIQATISLTIVLVLAARAINLL